MKMEKYVFSRVLLLWSFSALDCFANESPEISKIIFKHQELILKLEERIKEQDRHISHQNKMYEIRLQEMEKRIEIQNRQLENMKKHVKQQNRKINYLDQYMKTELKWSNKEDQGRENSDVGLIKESVSTKSDLVEKPGGVIENIRHKIPKSQYMEQNMFNSAARLTKRDLSHAGYIAFYAYMSSGVDYPGKQQILVFDDIKTNIGHHYNGNDGRFTSPDNGVYCFTWTISIGTHAYSYTELMVNSNAYGNIVSHSGDTMEFHQATGIAVVQLSRGQVVYVRTHTTASIRGPILSDSFRRTSFSGWKLF